MPKGEKKLFECLLCFNRYSRHSFDTGGFYVSSGVCADCYKKMQKQPIEISCFGKLPVLKKHGYDADNIACSTICPDRQACAHFVSKLQRKG